VTEGDFDMMGAELTRIKTTDEEPLELAQTGGKESSDD
jgi:hypothetical protein